MESKAPVATKGNERSIITKEYNLKNKLDRKMYTDQTVKFPVTSFCGNQYIMVLFELDSNNILVEPMKSRTAGNTILAYQTLVNRLKEKCIHPAMHLLNNECSAEMKIAIQRNGMKYQLVPPHDHIRNIAEKAIHVIKDHFVSVLCGTDENFPLQLWCQILRHAEHQLNLLRKSRVVPTVSAFSHMYGQHNYDA